jgi:hypothetical protein
VSEAGATALFKTLAARYFAEAGELMRSIAPKVA